MAPAVGVRVMSARFASVCGICSGRIAAGESIRYVKGLAATHDGCGDPVGDPVVSGRGSGRRRYSGRSTYAARCSHIDYPCCGCE